MVWDLWHDRSVDLKCMQECDGSLGAHLRQEREAVGGKLRVAWVELLGGGWLWHRSGGFLMSDIDSMLPISIPSH